MKIQLDTQNKTIQLEQEVVLSTLIETLEKLLPNGEWKDFTLETNTVIHQWSNPVVIPSVIPYPVPPYPRPSWPWYSSTRLESNLHPADDQGSAGRNSTMMLKKGVYNIQA
jgi:hypothetical protein